MTREEAIDIIKCLAWHTRPNEEDIERAIKALEQEPKIEPIAEIKFDDDMLHEIVEEAVKNIEIEPKWIPVSERFPEVGSEVLVCYEFNGKRSVYIADFYGDGDFHGLDDEYLTAECRKYRKAIAWMPLPEPYKAESEDKG